MSFTTATCNCMNVTLHLGASCDAVDPSQRVSPVLDTTVRLGLAGVTIKHPDLVYITSNKSGGWDVCRCIGCGLLALSNDTSDINSYREHDIFATNKKYPGVYHIRKEMLGRDSIPPNSAGKCPYSEAFGVYIPVRLPNVLEAAAQNAVESAVVSAEEERLLKDTEKRAIDIEKRGMDERIRNFIAKEEALFNAKVSRISSERIVLQSIMCLSKASSSSSPNQAVPGISAPVSKSPALSVDVRKASSLSRISAQTALANNADDGVGDLMFETDDTIGAGDNGDDMDEPDDVGFIRGAGRGRDIDSNSTDHVDFLTQGRSLPIAIPMGLPRAVTTRERGRDNNIDEEVFQPPHTMVDKADWSQVPTSKNVRPVTEILK